MIKDMVMQCGMAAAVGIAADRGKSIDESPCNNAEAVRGRSDGKILKCAKAAHRARGANEHAKEGHLEVMVTVEVALHAWRTGCGV